MKATFDPDAKDLAEQIREFVAVHGHAYGKRTGKRPSWLTVSPEMMQCIRKIQADEWTTNLGTPIPGPLMISRPQLIGIPVKIGKKMTGCVMSINTRKPPSPQAQARAKTMKLFRRALKDQVKASPFLSIITPPRVGLDNSLICDVSVRMPVPNPFITLDFSINNKGLV